jgi:hypothetical protein
MANEEKLMELLRRAHTVIGEGLIENALDEGAEELHDEIGEVLGLEKAQRMSAPSAATHAAKTTTTCTSRNATARFSARNACQMRTERKEVMAAIKAPDVLVRNEGTVVVFCPLTSAAKAWIDENVQTGALQWFGNALCVEYCFAWGLAQGMKDAGLALE